MTTNGDETPLRRSRWLFSALVVSLALNLLVAGSMGAAYWQHRNGGPGGWRGDDVGLMGFVRKLPKERQSVLRDDVKLARESLQPLKDAARAAWVAANTTLATEPFDQQAVTAAFQNMTDAEATWKTAISAALINTASKLTPQERQTLSEWRNKRRGGKRERGPLQ